MPKVFNKRTDKIPSGAIYVGRPDLVLAKDSKHARDLELLDAYAVLGVSPTTPLEVVEMAWKGWQKKLHPDLQQDPVEKKRQEEKLKAINEAWTTIKAKGTK